MKGLIKILLLLGALVPSVAYAQTCSAPPTCSAGQASSWNGTAWTCVNVGGGTTGVVTTQCGVNWDSAWGLNNILTFCSPPACPAGFTDRGTGCGTNGAGKYRHAVFCERSCISNGLVGATYELKCPYYANVDGLANAWCTPNTCAAGDIDLGVIGCETKNGDRNPWQAGICKRGCITK